MIPVRVEKSFALKNSSIVGLVYHDTVIDAEYPVTESYFTQYAFRSRRIAKKSERLLRRYN